MKELADVGGGEAEEDGEGGPDVGAEVDGISGEGFAVVLASDGLKFFGAGVVDDDGEDEDGEGPDGEAEGEMFAEEDAVDGFGEDPYAGGEHEDGFDGGGEAFDLAVAVGVVGVGGTVGDLNGEEGDGGGDEVDAGVSGFRKHAEGAGEEASDELEQGDSEGGDDGEERSGTLCTVRGRGLVGLGRCAHRGDGTWFGVEASVVDGRWEQTERVITSLCQTLAMLTVHDAPEGACRLAYHLVTADINDVRRYDSMVYPIHFRVAASLLALAISLTPGVAAAERGALTVDEKKVADTMTEIFDAATHDDLAKFHSLTTPGFYLYDGGSRYDGDSIMNLTKAAHAKGTHYTWSVIDPDVHISGDTAWIAYVDKGGVTDASGSTKLQWLDSAFLNRERGVWKVAFMHSSHASTPPAKKN